MGKKYEYDDLPEEVRVDIDVQFEDNLEESPDDYLWKFKLMKPKDLEEYLQSQFGDYLDEVCEDDYMIGLIADIKKRGIDWPSVGVEGNHRALACWYLNIPLPYLEPVYKY